MKAYRAFENGRLRASDLPEALQVISAKTEQERADTLRRLGIGRPFMYQLWKEQLQDAAQLLTGSQCSPADVRERAAQRVHEKVKSMVQTLKSHLESRDRAPMLQRGVHVSIFGPPNAGKSTFLNVLGMNCAEHILFIYFSFLT